MATDWGGAPGWSPPPDRIRECGRTDAHYSHPWPRIVSDTALVVWGPDVEIPTQTELKTETFWCEGTARRPFRW